MARAAGWKSYRRGSNAKTGAGRFDAVGTCYGTGCLEAGTVPSRPLSQRELSRPVPPHYNATPQEKGPACNAILEHLSLPVFNPSRSEKKTRPMLAKAPLSLLVLTRNGPVNFSSFLCMEKERGEGVGFNGGQG